MCLMIWNIKVWQTCKKIKNQEGGQHFFHTTVQTSPNLVLECRCPAEFSSNPNQTNLNQVIKVLLGILETFMQVCSGKLELSSARHRPSRTKCGDPCFIVNSILYKRNTIKGISTMQSISHQEKHINLSNFIYECWTCISFFCCIFI